MSTVFDAVNPIERVRLSSQLATSVGTLKASANPLERVRATAQVAELLRQLGADEPKPAPKIRNFSWDAVKLSSLSMDDLNTLRAQVEAEHANPRNESGRYLENGQPSLYLYDRKGRKKLDALSWAVTYKLQEASKAKGAGVAPLAMPSHWKEKLLAGAEPQDIVTPEQVRAMMDGHEGMFEDARFRGEASADEVGEQVKTLSVARLGKEVERGAMLKQSGQWDLAINSAMSQLALSRTLVNIGTRKNAQAPDGLTGVGAPYFQRAEMYANGGKAQLASARGIAAFLAALELRATKPKEPTKSSFDKHLLSAEEVAALIARKDETPQPGPSEDTEHVIVEHVTGKGKTLRGIVRTDLSYADAKAIDPYTFKSGNGYFIREKHLIT